MDEITDKSIILEWLQLLEHNRNRTAGTVNKYCSYLTGLSDWLKSRGKDLRQAEKEDLEEYTGIEAHRRNIAPRSRRPMISGIKNFYAWALTQWYVKEDPAASLQQPSAGERLPKGMTLKNAETLIMQPGLAEFIDVRDTAILSVLMGCGLRVGGLVALNQEDLIFTEFEGDEWLVLRVVEKGDKERYVPVPQETRLLIRAYLGHADLEQLNRTTKNGRQVLFVSTRNRTVPAHEYYGEALRLSEWSVHDMIVKRGKRAGLPRDQCHPHALRHLYGTELTESDVQQHKIQVLMGHSSPKSTARYQHVATRSLIAAVKDANPLSKINTPVTALAKHLSK